MQKTLVTNEGISPPVINPSITSPENYSAAVFLVVINPSTASLSFMSCKVVITLFAVLIKRWNTKFRILADSTASELLVSLFTRFRVILNCHHTTLKNILNWVEGVLFFSFL